MLLAVWMNFVIKEKQTHVLVNARRSKREINQLELNGRTDYMASLLLALKFVVGTITVILFFVLILNFYQIRYSLSRKHRAIFLVFILFGVLGILSSISYGFISKQGISNNIADTAYERSQPNDEIDKLAKLTDILFGVQELALFIFVLKLFKKEKGVVVPSRN